MNLTGTVVGEPSELRPGDHEVRKGGEEQLVLVKGGGHLQDTGYLSTGHRDPGTSFYSEAALTEKFSLFLCVGILEIVLLSCFTGMNICMQLGCDDTW